MKRILLSLCALIAFLPLTQAQMAPDLDTLGNVWIVTIDDSGSMLRLSRNPYNNAATYNPSSLAAAVSERLKTYRIYDDMDFEHDRFMFYRSGFSFNAERGLGNELAVAASLDTSFIHHTDAKLYKLKDRNALIKQVNDLIASGRYKHDLSFVSHIRTFSAVKTVNYLKDAGQAQNFSSLRFITITDDADQNDQWRTDYKLLSVADNIKSRRKPISQRVKETIQEYVYNELTGIGGGVFRQLFKDDSVMPHIWVYEYTTVKSMSDTLRRNVLRLDAHDGKHMTFVPRHIYFGEDSLCFYGVDSVVVNGEAHVIGKNFNERYEASFPYRNGVRFNDIKVYGSVQFKYEDDIYGPHYRKVRFVQEQMIPSGMWAFIFTVLGILVGITLVGFLVYRFIILPRRTIATIYSGNGSKIHLKRGFRFQWKNEVTPVAFYETDRYAISNVLVRKCSNVVSATTDMVTGKKDLLISSKVRLNVSDSDLEHNSMEDLDKYYECQSTKYPAMLKEQYRTTKASRLRARFNGTSNPIVRWWCTSVLSVLDRFFPVYYYYFQNVSKYESICFESSDLLVDRKFIVESDSKSGKVSPTLEEIVVNKALTIYYSDPTVPTCEALLCYDIYEGKEYWNIIQLDDPTALQNSLKNAFVVYRYVKDADEVNKLKNQQALLTYARKAMRRYSLGVLDCSGINVAEIASFNVASVPVPGFVSMVEYSQNPKAMVLYSPFKDGFIKYKYISLKTSYADGHLYLSFLPYRFVKPDPRVPDSFDEQKLRQLSTEIIRTNDWTSGKMTFENDILIYKGIRADMKY